MSREDRLLAPAWFADADHQNRTTRVLNVSAWKVATVDNGPAVGRAWTITVDAVLLLEEYSSSLTMGRIEIPPGTLYMLVLKTLDRQGPMHGYGIAEHIEQMSSDVLQVEEGSLYPALQRMLIKGWVKAEWGLSENNRRARYYRLTAAGKRQMADEVADFTRVMEAITRVIQPA